MFEFCNSGFRDHSWPPRSFISLRATTVWQIENDYIPQTRTAKKRKKKKREHPLWNELPILISSHLSLTAPLPLLLYYCVTPHHLMPVLILPAPCADWHCPAGQSQQGETLPAQRQQQTPELNAPVGSDSRLRICHYTRASGSVRSICLARPRNKHMTMLLSQNPFLGNRWLRIEICDFYFHCINLGLSFRKFTRQGDLKTPRAMFPWKRETDKALFLCHANFEYLLQNTRKISPKHLTSSSSASSLDHDNGSNGHF